MAENADRDVDGEKAGPRAEGPAPAFELRWGGLHVTVDRVPRWTVTAVTVVLGSAGTWLAVPRR
ncbi:hypothetical protein [Streptomyces tremellae]|uniref:Uncharacterized protein n=1 Tax=Streptomyces tremellae TaxID=1124239 RepID=A0ABP7F1K0_9ACTN